MRWKREVPELGDVRTRRIFLFIPRFSADGDVRWLEWATVRELFDTVGTGPDDLACVWVFDGFADEQIGG